VSTSNSEVWITGYGRNYSHIADANVIAMTSKVELYC